MSKRIPGGFTVALVGPDGAGKSTIAKRVVTASPWDATYLYMGVNLETSKLMLPTTRLLIEIKRRSGGKPDLTASTGGGGSSWRSAVRITNLILEEWFRALVTWIYRRRGRLIVMDRHFKADYRLHDMDQTQKGLPVAARLHGWLLRSVYPSPDLVIVLTTSPQTLHDRKPDDSLESRIRRHSEYVGLDTLFDDVESVDVAEAIEVVKERCLEIIGDRLGDH